MKQSLAALALCLFASTSHALDYLDAHITGIGLVAGEDHIRFTIDVDPAAVLTTQQFTGEQLKRVVSLIYAAYVAQSPVKFIRSSDNTANPVKHYTQLQVLSVGEYTFD
jgi:hypothetical protein